MSIAAGLAPEQFIAEGEESPKRGDEETTCSVSSGDVRYKPQREVRSVGGASLLSRMNYAGSSPTTSTNKLVSMVSRHNCVGFPLLLLPKDPLKVAFNFLDMKSLSILSCVNKELLVKSYANELWKSLTLHDFKSEDIADGTVNWRLEYKYLKAKYKRIRNYPKYQMMGLLGRMKKIEREVFPTRGWSFYACDRYSVTFSPSAIASGGDDVADAVQSSVLQIVVKS